MTIKTHSFEILRKANQYEAYSVCVTHFLTVSQYFWATGRVIKTALHYKSCLHFLLVKKLDYTFQTSLHLEQYAQVGKSDGPLAHNNFCALLHTLSSLKVGPMETSQATLHILPSAPFLHFLFYEEIFIPKPVTCVIYFRNIIIQYCVRLCHSIPELTTFLRCTDKDSHQ